MRRCEPAFPPQPKRLPARPDIERWAADPDQAYARGSALVPFFAGEARLFSGFFLFCPSGEVVFPATLTAQY